MFLLLLVVNNTRILLMMSLNAINSKNMWSLYRATVLSLLLTFDKRTTRLVVIAWDDNVAIPWQSVWPNQFLHGMIWSSSHLVINNIKQLIVVWDSALLPFPCSHQSCGVWGPLESGGDCQHNLYVQLVWAQLLLLLLLQWTTLFVKWCNHVNIASRNDNIKVFDQRICCNGSCRQTSFIAGAMALLQWWRIAIGAISLTAGALCLCNCWRSLPSCSL